MESPSSSTRFTLLPTSYLASQSPSSEITLQSLIDTSDRMAEEAREALPYSFDECTYDKGYLRQSVWSCLDCGEKGVCYGCSISCHSEHRLVELWTRRSFRCDCPTTSTQPEPKPPAKRRRCQLYPPQSQPQEANEKNHYTQNYAGKFCRCGRDYDAETETEAMICCIACEDWFHETCLNLRPTLSPSIPSQSVQASMQDATDTNAGEDEDDEESAVLIKSDTYDGLICAACVKDNGYLRKQAGKEGWMIIEPVNSQGGWKVIGQQSETSPTSLQNPEVAPVSQGGLTGKRKVEDADSEESKGENEDSKRIKLENGLSTPITATNEATITLPSISTKGLTENDEKTDFSEWKWKGRGDIFLANGIRDKLVNELDEKTTASLPFPLVDEEIYEPPKDDEQEETIEQVTSRVMTSLPRVQAIEALHGYQKLKDRLNSMLQGHVASGKTVSKEDIEGLFEQLKGRS
ncbi:uncharacterized protein L201_005057 [Kwoniella dendrophila CBS 6074]|uniref:UBR-type domain-containing protein n=1 Tax=Kwoniella dendrophila CBS 6074 TaxID=1295534 RepID=A0AAX4JZ32_9TREE